MWGDFMELEYNEIYSYMFETDARVIVLVGGADSGKSYFVGDQYIPYCMMKEEYFRGLMTRKYATSIKDSVFQEIVDGIETDDAEHLFRTTVSPMEIKYKKNKKSKALFKGIDDTSKLKSIKGLNLIWIEEAEEINEEEFEDLFLRLRGGGYERIILTFNPVDEDHFSNERFCLVHMDNIYEYNQWGEPQVWDFMVEDKIDDELVQYKVLVIRTTYHDNAFIPPARKLAIEKLKETNPIRYNIYARGLYGVHGEKILSNWRIADLYKPDEEGVILVDTFDNIQYGIDWGFFPDPYRFISMHVDIKHRKIYIFDEINLYEKTNIQTAPLVKEKLHKPNAQITADSSEPKSIKDYRSYGFKMRKAKKGPDSVRFGIQKMKEFEIIIDKRCIGSIKDVKNYRYKKDRHGKVTKEPEDLFNHTPDIIRYILEKFSLRGGIKL